MKLVVISPEHEDPREVAVLGGLLEAGLERYHVRKPGWSAEKLEAWLRALPTDWRPHLIPHTHHELVDRLGLGGRHGCNVCSTPVAAMGRDGRPARPQHTPDVDGANGRAGRPSLPVFSGQSAAFVSRSCHTPAELRDSLGQFDSVFFGPVFPSLSKSGYEPSRFLSHVGLAQRLNGRTPAERGTTVLALGGVTAERLGRCRELGFDGAALLGTVWMADDPVAAFREMQAAAFEKKGVRFPVMAIVQDAEQAERLCAAGALWIQLRVKNAAHDAWLELARKTVAVCRAHGAVCIINDSVEIARAVDADGVHLGANDPGWREARARLGPDRLIGGTVNDDADADRALATGCLDYVGVGPLRFTATKEKLAPLLGFDGVRALLSRLDGLPAWVIGGVEPADLPALRSMGAAGAAVSSALFRDGRPEKNLHTFLAAWNSPAAVPARP
jgi:thiamine-phosphate pyrophosphorylase